MKLSQMFGFTLQMQAKEDQLYGKKDKICSFDLAEQMKASLVNSHLVVFENSGHSLFLEETQKFNMELIKFARQ